MDRHKWLCIKHLWILHNSVGIVSTPGWPPNELGGCYISTNPVFFNPQPLVRNLAPALSPGKTLLTNGASDTRNGDLFTLKTPLHCRAVSSRCAMVHPQWFGRPGESHWGFGKAKSDANCKNSSFRSVRIWLATTGHRMAKTCHFLHWGSTYGERPSAQRQAVPIPKLAFGPITETVTRALLKR